MEGPELLIVDQIVEAPETQTIQRARTSEMSGTAFVCQVSQAEIGKVIEIGASIPAESASPIFVICSRSNFSQRKIKLTARPHQIHKLEIVSRQVFEVHSSVPIFDFDIPCLKHV